MVLVIILGGSRILIAGNPNFTNKSLGKIAKSLDTSVEILKKLVSDEDEFVRNRPIRNPNYQ